MSWNIVDDRLIKGPNVAKEVVQKAQKAPVGAHTSKMVLAILCHEWL